MGLISLNITYETAQVVASIVDTFVKHWVPIVIFSLCLSFIVILVFLCVTQLPKIFSSVISFIDTATVNFPVLTKSIHDLIVVVEKMNGTLAALLNIQVKIDELKDLAETEFEAIKVSIKKLSNRLP